ncbi:hypothetical protein [Sphingobacterium hungaricum]|uniref:LTXXQ motif family protein n=1 Tax=Sphingobacterium hungaricum TaxID=2082723 RepID=A0A928YPB4_9SPHI|nr:hypothetical protein [Sphingobacterium hungaricum]MBE8712946.1 hypothetical protein [Sphingobacterium hungaricum]
MKKLILTGLSFLFAITLTFAQQANPEQKAVEAVAELTQKLTLTETQQQAIYPIILEQTKAKHALKEDKTLSPDVLKEQLNTIWATTDAKIVEQLTDEQKPIYAEIVKERQAKKVDKVQPVKQDTVAAF